MIVSRHSITVFGVLNTQNHVKPGFSQLETGFYANTEECCTYREELYVLFLHYMYHPVLVLQYLVYSYWPWSQGIQELQF